MAVCHNCNRMLSPNGSCVYCGTAAMRDVFGKPMKRKAVWRKRILLLLLAALVTHFFFFTPTGKGMTNPLLEKVGLRVTSPAPPENP